MKLSGIVPPLVTPLAGPDSLDQPGLERLIEHVLNGGVHALFILGTTGEGPSLSYRLRREVIDRVCGQANQRVPVLVGITDTSLVESIALARHAEEAGAAAVVAAPPYYFPVGQDDLVHHFASLAVGLPLPLYVYNMPAMTKLSIEPDSIGRLLDCERIHGLKDSSGDFAQFEAYLEVTRQRPDWSVLIGPEHLTARAVLAGGDGGVNGGANLRPRLFVNLYEAAYAGDLARTSSLQAEVERLGSIYGLGTAGAVIRGLKRALAQEGLCSGTMAEPFAPVAPIDRLQTLA